MACALRASEARPACSTVSRSSGDWTAKISGRRGRYATGPSSKASAARSVTMDRRTARGGRESARAYRSDRRRWGRLRFEDDFADAHLARWLLRNDTFPGNLGVFRPANVTAESGDGLSLKVLQEPLGVRNFSAASISSRGAFLYGRFEAILRATSVSGLVTGFFLHRESPRQEIDV